MVLKPKEIRGMKGEERQNALTEAQKDLMHERGVAAMGGAMRNPGKIRALRRQIARIITIQNQPEAAPAAKAAKKTPKKAPAKGLAKRAPGSR